MIYPIRDVRITQYFNDPRYRDHYKKYDMDGHNGLDFGTAHLPSGKTETIAPEPMIITYQGYEGARKGYGRFFFGRSEKYEHVFAHLHGIKSNSIMVRKGQKVVSRQVLALTDNTGDSSGPHLHWGVRPINYNRNNGFLGYINPLPLVDGIIEEEKYMAKIQEQVDDIIKDLRNAENLKGSLGKNLSVRLEQLRSSIEGSVIEYMDKRFKEIYSLKDHTHDKIPEHTHGNIYALKDHRHDNLYSPIEHTHKKLKELSTKELIYQLIKKLTGVKEK